MPPPSGCPKRGHPYPEVTGAFCRVPSTPFSQAPWYSLPVHLCWFGVRAPRELASGFSWQHRIGDFACCGSASRLRIDEARICLVLSLLAYPRTTIAWDHLPSCVPALLASTRWVGSSPSSLTEVRASPSQPRFSMGAHVVVPEYQPVVHRLRLSASS